MNTNRIALFARIGNTALLTEMLTRKIAEKTVGNVSQDLREIIESIPSAIEIAATQRLNYARVALITECADFLVPRLSDRYFSKAPRREWLCADAAFIYDFCQAGGFRVELAPYEKRNVAFFKSAITIEWNDLSGFRPTGTFEKIPLLRIMRENRIEYPPTQAAEIRKRVTSVLQLLPTILFTLESAIDEHKNEQWIYEENFALDRDKRQTGIDDVVTLCELLDIETQTRPRHPVRNDGRKIIYADNRKYVFAVNLRKM